MANSVNKVILVGNLGRDPEVRYTASGAAVANFSLATSRNFKNKVDEWESETEWHKIVVFGNQAKPVGDYLRKGRKVYVEGRMQTREWQDKEGNTRRTTEIVANQVVFLDKGTSSGGGAASSYSEPSGGGGGGSEEPIGGEDGPMDDDIPF